MFLCRKKLKSTSSDILLKTTNNYGRFSAKAFLVRGTAIERHACSYTVWRDVSLKFISANKGLPRAILFHDIYVREFVSGISVISVEFTQSVLNCKNCIKAEVDHDLWWFTVKSVNPSFPWEVKSSLKWKRNALSIDCWWNSYSVRLQGLTQSDFVIFISPRNPWNPYSPLLFLRVLPSMNFTSSQCLMHFCSFLLNVLR